MSKPLPDEPHLNIQNIPIRTKEGAKIRRAITHGHGVIVRADYEEIERQVMAHFARAFHRRGVR